MAVKIKIGDKVVVRSEVWTIEFIEGITVYLRRPSARTYVLLKDFAPKPAKLWTAKIELYGTYE